MAADARGGGGGRLPGPRDAKAWWEGRSHGIARSLKAALEVYGLCSWPESTVCLTSIVRGGGVQSTLKHGGFADFFMGRKHV